VWVCQQLRADVHALSLSNIRRIGRNEFMGVVEGVSVCTVAFFH